MNKQPFPSVEQAPFHKSSTSHLTKDVTDCPPVVLGSTGTMGGQSEDLTSLAPPIANREVQITIPLENRSLLDWVSFTLKVNDPREALGIIGLLPSLFVELDYGFSGYRKSLRFGNICIYYAGRDDMGCHVEMSGQGCRQYEAQFDVNPWQELFKTVLNANGNFTRLDLALDNIDGALNLKRIHDALRDHERQIRTIFSDWSRYEKGSFRAGEKITGETIYIGSTKSHIFFRIYDKAQETGIDGEWIRFEIEMRNNRAQEVARLFISDIYVGCLATGIINNYFAIINNDDSNKSRCTLQSWWAEWLQSTEKISLTTEKATRYVSDTMQFIKRQYAPSLAMINKHLGPGQFKSFIQETVHDGSQRMSTKHEQILAASATITISGRKSYERK